MTEREKSGKGKEREKRKKGKIRNCKDGRKKL